MSPSKAWAPLDDPRDVVRHDTAGAEAEPAILSRFEKWLAIRPGMDDLWCEHATYVGFGRSLAFLCPRCSEYAEAADNSHPRPEWDDEELPDGFKKVAA